MPNKIKYGLTNVYRAAVTVSDEGVVTYGTPVRIRGAVSLSVSASGEQIDIAADDDPQYVSVTENNGYEGSIEFQDFSDEDRVACLGATLDANRNLVESKNDQPKPQALLFEFQGDVKATRHVLYNCLFSRPDVASQTKGEGIDPSTDTLNITCRPAKDTGYIKFKTGVETPASVYDSWFTAVPLPSDTAAPQSVNPTRTTAKTTDK